MASPVGFTSWQTQSQMLVKSACSGAVSYGLLGTAFFPVAFGVLVGAEAASLGFRFSRGLFDYYFDSYKIDAQSKAIAALRTLPAGVRVLDDRFLPIWVRALQATTHAVVHASAMTLGMGWCAALSGLSISLGPVVAASLVIATLSSLVDELVKELRGRYPALNICLDREPSKRSRKSIALHEASNHLSTAVFTALLLLTPRGNLSPTSAAVMAFEVTACLGLLLRGALLTTVKCAQADSLCAPPETHQAAS
ncbi:MAG: hypothetical protein ACOYKZ_03410 [Chlamydiia bacterium]